VHARGGRPCPRCGMPIRIQPQGEHARLTYFCPRCQAVPRSAPNGRTYREPLEGSIGANRSTRHGDGRLAT
jgi:endogenous inhibitor of DNA gyrase (YacG/DUF329 family)